MLFFRPFIILETLLPICLFLFIIVINLISVISGSFMHSPRNFASCDLICRYNQKSLFVKSNLFFSCSKDIITPSVKRCINKEILFLSILHSLMVVFSPKMWDYATMGYSVNCGHCNFVVYASALPPHKRF